MKELCRKGPTNVCLCYRGLHPVSDEEVIAMYEGCHIPLEIMSDFYGKVIRTDTSDTTLVCLCIRKSV